MTPQNSPQKNDPANPSNPNNPDPNTPKPTFAWISTNVLNAKCAKCHSGGGAKAGFNVESYDSIMAYTNDFFVKAVEPKSPEASLLYTTVKPGGSMPPSRDSKLSPEVVVAIYDWIKNGAEK